MVSVALLFRTHRQLVRAEVLALLDLERLNLRRQPLDRARVGQRRLLRAQQLQVKEGAQTDLEEQEMGERLSIRCCKNKFLVLRLVYKIT